MDHYVYEWWRTDLNLPYYIGKGVGDRAHDPVRNRHANNVTKFLSDSGIRREVRIIAKFASKKAAFEYEVERISFWWDLKEYGILTNQTKGGNGGRPLPEIIEKIRETCTGQKRSDETKLRMKTSNSRDVANENNPMFGKEHPNRGKFFVNGALVSMERPAKLQKRRPEDVAKWSGENHGNYGKPSAMRGKKNPGVAAANKARWEKYRADKAARLAESEKMGG